MRRAALLAALAVAGCGGGQAATSNGFSAEPPGGWADETDNAETRTGSDFEAVYEGTAVQGIAPILTVTRVKAAPGRTVEAAARTARIAVDRRFEEADPTQPVEVELGGEPALQFDYGSAEKRARYVTARHGSHLYAVTVQAGADDFQHALAVMRDYLESWRWDA